MQNIGRLAFILGVIIAIAAGVGVSAPQVPLVLAILGLIIGFLNIGGRESNNFLIAGIALSASAGSLSVLPEVGVYVTAIASNVAVFVGPALLVVALKSLIAGGHD